MDVIASGRFIKFKKKSVENLQAEIDNQVRNIIQNPEVGELKKGDLREIRVLKFKFNYQLFLLSYELFEDKIYLYTIGTHENFYKDLKKYK
ncbi:MAG: type II toxin-antitoxin system RelE/ParE family toxin [bacterium]|jgi:hypothetical protein